MKSLLLLGCLTLLSAGYITSCFKTAEITGPTIDQLNDAASKQKASTEVIDSEAKSIQRKSKEDSSKQSAAKIQTANVDLKNNIDILAKEADAKEDAEKALAAANERIAELEAEDNAWITWMCRGAIGIGILMTAVGVVIFIKTGFSQWEVGALGISLTVSAGLASWFFANIIWFIVGIFILAAIGVILWVFLRTDATAEAGIEVAEMLKARIKKLAVIESDEIEEDGRYVNYQEVTAIITDVFGDETHQGMAGTKQSTGVMAHITAKRKKLNKKLKTIY
jgi:hypothetical protein